MPDLLHYAGELPLPSPIADFFESLEREDFTVELTERFRPNVRRLTLFVRWRGVQVAYTNEKIWVENGGNLIGYRFRPGTDQARDACPKDFDLEAFSRQHECSPLDFFQRNDGEKSYLRVRSAEAALRVLRASARRVDRLVFTDSADSRGSLQRDLDQIRSRTDVAATTREQLCQARVGQGQFRADLDRIFYGRCAVSGLALRQALRASHILPWSKATDAERLDPNNGLLLSANLDALFDKHLISFGPEGEILFSTLITPNERTLLGPLGNLARRPSPQQWRYLQQHNLNFDELVRRQQKSDSAN
jgi:hypothetical protein